MILDKLKLYALGLLAIAAPAAADWGPYAASVVRVIDGDSLVVDVALWPGLTERAEIRLAGIDTPELKGPTCGRAKALAAKDALTVFVAGGGATLTVAGFDKFKGRYDGAIAINGQDAGAMLIAKGLAHPYNGSGPRPPWC